MTLTEPLIRHTALDSEFLDRTYGWSDRAYVQLAMAGCVAFWLIVGAVLFVTL